MARLETTEHWAQILELKDQLSLRELAERFGTSPGLISAALRRTQTGRTAITSEAAEAQVDDKGSESPAPAPAPAASTDEHPEWWSLIEADLNTAPIHELAARAGITPGQLASTLQQLGHRRVPLTDASTTTRKASSKRTKSRQVAAGAQAWAVGQVHKGQEEQVVVMASNIAEAVSRAQSLPGTTVRVALLGRAIL